MSLIEATRAAHFGQLASDVALAHEIAIKDPRENNRSRRRARMGGAEPGNWGSGRKHSHLYGGLAPQPLRCPALEH